ncbi:ATP/GTP-binding protein [Streptomyces sp. NPDC058867]|uniref:ATP/GTP-binding protein n=1 Tax=unclassified Streptomyces TaxID=2593676 RepID=UPI0036806857
MDPQPPPGSMFYGRTEDDPDGVVYMRTCRNGEGGTPVYTYFTAADGADVPAVDPVALAQQAVSKMRLSGPAIASPRANGSYVVGMPIWLWVNQTPTTYGPQTTSASAGGVTVSATATVTSISWDMGDGSSAVVCDGPGTKYDPSVGKARSPDCGHVYDKASANQVGSKFTVAATATWTVDWQVDGGGEVGQFTEIRQSQEQVPIGEVQVVR